MKAIILVTLFGVVSVTAAGLLGGSRYGSGFTAGWTLGVLSGVVYAHFRIRHYIRTVLSERSE